MSSTKFLQFTDKETKRQLPSQICYVSSHCISRIFQITSYQYPEKKRQKYLIKADVQKGQ